uniref:NADH-ubiquinone oxidoreductase chain 4 n=1 Tax=Cyphoderus albinus TaxID=1499079 RepID=A0A6H0EWT8_9HEXA|nr:NADH dehydrogenase subunit 4 [Cyphoderus albinus]QIT06453.1 NADH dehydrogenase subunit 4 [Cyphoderus albinus]
MMKFILVSLLGAISLMMDLKLVWLLSGWMVIFLLMLLLTGYFFLVDFTFFSASLGGDVLSFSLVLLSIWISVMMYYGSVSSVTGNMLYFNVFVYMLMFILLVTFYVTNLLSFYFFFEASLIPTLLIIMGWGYQPERLQAGIYFLFYTLLASLPLLISLLLLYWDTGSLELMSFFYTMSMNYSVLGLLFILAFLVKLPMYFVHLWLPKAHVEAPVAGSMILAGVLLKLGGYGLMRLLPLCLSGLVGLKGLLYGLSILGMSYLGFMCCRLNDLKALVAYSSVAHMALVLCGCLGFSLSGYSGSLMMMISHGVSSSGLFCMVNMYYERSSSRSFFLNSGLLLLFPLFTLFFFLLCGANMAAPPTINLLSEIYLMISILKYDVLMLLMFPLGSFLGAVFTIYLFSYSQHGANYLGGYSILNTSYREFHVLNMHTIPVYLMVLKSESFMMMF